MLVVGSNSIEDKTLYDQQSLGLFRIRFMYIYKAPLYWISPQCRSGLWYQEKNRLQYIFNYNELLELSFSRSMLKKSLSQRVSIIIDCWWYPPIPKPINKIETDISKSFYRNSLILTYDLHYMERFKLVTKEELSQY